MNGSTNTLKEIHRLMRYLADLNEKITGGPKTLKATQLALARHEENLKQTHEAVKHLKVKILEKESSIKQSQQHIVKLEQTSVNNKKEYDALRAEIALAQKTIRGIEDKILEDMGAIEVKQAQIPELEKAVTQAKAELARLESDFQEMQGRFAEEKTRTQTELKELEKTLPEKLLPVYQRLVASKGSQALAAVEKRTCQACYTEITQQMSNELALGHFMQCKNCDRLIYLA